MLWQSLLTKLAGGCASAANLAARLTALRRRPLVWLGRRIDLDPHRTELERWLEAPESEKIGQGRRDACNCNIAQPVGSIAIMLSI